MKVEVTYSGFPAPDLVIESVSEAVRKGAEAVAENARNICPVDTGTLKNSIAVAYEGGRAEISANTDYAAYVEFGTSKMSAQPFLVPSLLGNESAVLDAIAGALELR